MLNWHCNIIQWQRGWHQQLWWRKNHPPTNNVSACNLVTQVGVKGWLTVWNENLNFSFFIVSVGWYRWRLIVWLYFIKYGDEVKLYLKCRYSWSVSSLVKLVSPRPGVRPDCAVQNSKHSTFLSHSPLSCFSPHYPSILKDWQWQKLF